MKIRFRFIDLVVYLLILAGSHYDICERPLRERSWNNRPTFLYFIDKATAAINELQEFKDYFENIESLTYNAKLDQSSVDILLKYNEFVANSEKERLSKHLEEVDSTLDEHYDKFKHKIRDSEGVWLSRKVFWWTVVIIYGLLVITFLLGCFWCSWRLG